MSNFVPSSFSFGKLSTRTKTKKNDLTRPPAWINATSRPWCMRLSLGWRWMPHCRQPHQLSRYAVWWQTYASTSIVFSSCNELQLANGSMKGKTNKEAPIQALIAVSGLHPKQWQCVVLHLQKRRIFSFFVVLLLALTISRNWRGQVSRLTVTAATLWTP